MATRRIEVASGDDYLIIHRDGEEKGECIDISYATNTIRLYQEKAWRIHPMNKDSRTTSVEVLETS